MSTNQESLKDLFTMGPQRIFRRVMLASIIQIMLQVMPNTLPGSPNADHLVYWSERNSFLHSNYPRKYLELSSGGGGCSFGRISSLHHPRRYYMSILG